jgi:glycerophosphoryl diester phosphodiesterase
LLLHLLVRPGRVADVEPALLVEAGDDGPFDVRRPGDAFDLEADVQRSKDGTLVIIHDDKVDRTTDGVGKVSELTIAQLKKLDAGAWFSPAFKGERIPTLEEVFSLLHGRKSNVLVAMDLKISDATYEADIIDLAKRHKVLDQLVFIGRAIEHADVRKKLRKADGKTHTCVLAQTAKDLDAAIADADSNWVYTRFIPTEAEANAVRKAGKKLFLSGPPVNQLNVENYRKAREIQADALLTDFPLNCRSVWREAKR